MKDKKWRYIVSDNIDRIIDTVSSYNPEDEIIDKIDGVIQLDENVDIHALLEERFKYPKSTGFLTFPIRYAVNFLSQKGP